VTGVQTCALPISGPTDHTCRERYILHPGKTDIIFQGKVDRASAREWYLGEDVLSESPMATHLGVVRHTKDSRAHTLNGWIDKKLKAGFSAAYSMTSMGLHGFNGLNPMTCLHMYKTYILPKILYGLESVVLAKGHLRKLELLHRSLLRHFLSLPPGTAIPAVYMLYGTLPVEAEIHTRQLGLLGMILRSSSPLRDIALHQGAVREVSCSSWFVHVIKLLITYNLPAIIDMYHHPPSKDSWKYRVKTQIHAYWTTHLRKEAEEKTTLALLHTDSLSTMKAHPSISSVHSFPRDVQRTSVKVKLLTGQYLLAAVEAHHSRGRKEPTCPLCLAPNEDITHFLLQCPSTESVRHVYMEQIASQVEQHSTRESWASILASTTALVQCIMDPSVLVIRECLPAKNDFLQNLEAVSRHMCYSLHCRRAFLIQEAQVKGSAATRGVP
jgi:hypothetical protein